MKKDRVETAPVCVRIPVIRLESLKRLARTRAAAEDKDVRLKDLLLEAVDRVFPLDTTNQTAAQEQAVNQA